MIRSLRTEGEHNYGELIKAKRIEKGLSIRNVADLTGISAAALSRWESGKRIPSIDSYNKVMTALGAELLVLNK